MFKTSSRSQGFVSELPVRSCRHSSGSRLTSQEAAGYRVAMGREMWHAGLRWDERWRHVFGQCSTQHVSRVWYTCTSLTSPGSMAQCHEASVSWSPSHKRA